MNALSEKPRESSRGKFLWASSEQICFSATMILVQIIGSKTLSLEDYGIFTMVGATGLLLIRVQHAFIIEPTLVRAPSLEVQTWDFYLRGVASLERKTEVALALVGVILTIASSFRSPRASFLVLGATAYLLGLLALNFRRRFAYVIAKERQSAISTMLRGALGIAAWALLNQSVDAGVWALLLILGLLNWVSATLWARNISLGNLERAHHLRHGKVTIVILAIWGAIDAIPIYLLAMIAGAPSVAIYQVAAALFAPLVQLGGTLLLVVLRWLTTRQAGPISLSLLTAWTLGLSSVGATLMTLVGPTLVSLIFGERYVASSSLLVMLAPFSVLLLTAQTANNWCKAAGNQSPMILAGLVALPVMVAAIVVGHAGFGLQGVCLGVSAGYLALAASSLLLSAQTRRF